MGVRSNKAKRLTQFLHRSSGIATSRQPCIVQRFWYRFTKFNYKKRKSKSARTVNFGSGSTLKDRQHRRKAFIFVLLLPLALGDEGWPVYFDRRVQLQLWPLCPAIQDKESSLPAQKVNFVTLSLTVTSVMVRIISIWILKFQLLRYCAY